MARPNGDQTFLRSGFTMKPNYRPVSSSVGGGLQRANSVDLSLEMISKEAMTTTIDNNNITNSSLPPISEVEDAKCECCGMSEECTREYIARIREKYSGKWICGLCSEAVKEEVEKKGGGGRHEEEEALHSHMSACVSFNRFGRTHPILYQAEAMREILRKSSRSVIAKNKAGRSIARSSSCIPAITEEIQ